MKSRRRFRQTLDQIFSPNPYLNLDKYEHCKFLSEKLSVLQRFLVDSTNKCNDLEMVEDLKRRIRDVLYRAQVYVEELVFFSWKGLDLIGCIAPRNVQRQIIQMTNLCGSKLKNKASTNKNVSLEL
ncbi:hypothetical protein H5410_034971 [Solanum commersonii]|uniref:Uncharacterized protein n=1 Tax=Solanum commersonii TaxID=4109 RepID=A0A9J5XZF6_SOLCO|nr:hypothetical protein H5410_034971 [Solanum commersonii]